MGDFRRLSARCRGIVATQDTGTVRFAINVNDNPTRAVVVEEYESENALSSHGEHIGAELPAAVLATADVHGQLLGDLHDELRNSLISSPVVRLTPRDATADDVSQPCGDVRFLADPDTHARGSNPAKQPARSTTQPRGQFPPVQGHPLLGGR